MVTQECTSKGIGRRGTEPEDRIILQREPTPCRPMPSLVQLRRLSEKQWHLSRIEKALGVYDSYQEADTLLYVTAIDVTTLWKYTATTSCKDIMQVYGYTSYVNTICKRYMVNASYSYRFYRCFIVGRFLLIRHLWTCTWPPLVTARPLPHDITSSGPLHLLQQYIVFQKVPPWLLVIHQVRFDKNTAGVPKSSPQAEPDLAFTPATPKS